MSSPAPSRHPLVRTLRNLSSFFPRREDSADEARLYYRRACLAASEERYDVALIFCGKALDLDSRNLPTRLLVAQIRHRGLNEVDAAIAGYQKVITLAGYRPDDPYCAAAKAGLDQLLHSRIDAPRIADEAIQS